MQVPLMLLTPVDWKQILDHMIQEERRPFMLEVRLANERNAPPQTLPVVFTTFIRVVDDKREFHGINTSDSFQTGLRDVHLTFVNGNFILYLC